MWTSIFDEMFLKRKCCNTAADLCSGNRRSWARPAVAALSEAAAKVRPLIPRPSSAGAAIPASMLGRTPEQQRCRVTLGVVAGEVGSRLVAQTAV